jgi:hypothetical protein
MRRALVALLCSFALLPSLASAQKVLGDFILGQSVVCPWNTYDKSGNSATPGTAGTLYVSKDGDTATEKSVVANLSGTDTRAVDGDAGRHRAVIPTTDAYFVPDTTYEVVARGTVVDSQTFSSSICFFTIERMYPLRGAIQLRAKETSGQTSTVSQVYITAVYPTSDPVPSDGKWTAYRLWDFTDGWDRAIINSNAASDYLTIYPDAPAAPTDQAVLYITRDVIYPANLFNPATQTVVVGGMGATVAGSTAFTDNSGANAKAFFDNGGASIDSNSRLGTIGTNVANIATAENAYVLKAGTCSIASATTNCIDAALTQADGYWSNWSAIVVTGFPPRCVRGFSNSTHTLSWPEALPSSTANVTYQLIAAPQCRTYP